MCYGHKACDLYSWRNVAKKYRYHIRSYFIWNVLEYTGRKFYFDWYQIEIGIFHVIFNKLPNDIFKIRNIKILYYTYTLYFFVIAICSLDFTNIRNYAHLIADNANSPYIQPFIRMFCKCINSLKLMRCG